MIVFETYLVAVFYEEEWSVICSKRRLFCFALSAYLCLLHCNFYHLFKRIYCCWSFGFVLTVFCFVLFLFLFLFLFFFTCPWCTVIFITCCSALVALFVFWFPAILCCLFGIVAYSRVLSHHY